MGSLSLLQGIFSTQESNPSLLHCRWILSQLNHKGSPRILEWVAYPFSRGSCWPRSQTRVSYIAGGLFTNWAIREVCSDLREKNQQQQNKKILRIWDRKEQTCLRIESISLCSVACADSATFVNKSYLQPEIHRIAHFQGSDLQRCNTFPFHIEIKSYRTFVLVLVYKSSVTNVDSCQRKELWHQKVCNNQSHSQPF